MQWGLRWRKEVEDNGLQRQWALRCAPGLPIAGRGSWLIIETHPQAGNLHLWKWRARLPANAARQAGEAVPS